MAREVVKQLLPPDIGHPAYAPLRFFLSALGVPQNLTDLSEGGWPSLRNLNALAEERGLSVRFVTMVEPLPALEYERLVYEERLVPTREQNAHDFFNALCWLAFPRTKAAFNALHYHSRKELTAQGRGRKRDFATQLDESGLFVVAPPGLEYDFLVTLLAQRRWQELFVDHRAEIAKSWCFAICGHSIYEKLLRPYGGITAKVFILSDSLLSDAKFAEEGFSLSGLARLDQQVAQLCREALESRGQATAKFGPDSQGLPPLYPLPIWGVPGWCSANKDPTFYEDRQIFRPISALLTQ